jgi:hypothetical protein
MFHYVVFTSAIPGNLDIRITDITEKLKAEVVTAFKHHAMKKYR